MNVHRNIHAVRPHIPHEEVVALCFRQVVFEDLHLIGILSSCLFRFDFGLNILIPIVCFNQIEVIAECLHPVQIVGVGGVNHLSDRKMHLVPTVRHIMYQHERDHIAQTVAVHGSGGQHVDLTFRHPSGQKRRNQPSAAPKPQRRPFLGQPLDGALLEMIAVDMGQQYQLQLRHIRFQCLIGNAAVYQQEILQNRGVPIAPRRDDVVLNHQSEARSTASSTASASGSGKSIVLAVRSILGCSCSTGGSASGTSVISGSRSPLVVSGIIV